MPSKITAPARRSRGARRADDFADAARAIMTTDTYPKLATRKAEIDGVGGHHQRHRQGRRHDRAGHGDHAGLSLHRRGDRAAGAARLLDPGVDKTFNAITIDGDTSTSDTLLLFATGAAAARGAPRIVARHDPRLAAFRLALHDVMHDLALQIVKDGEGLTKFVTVKVTGAESEAAARRIAKSIANSPLVKTAIAGEDPNWGRIVTAVGKAGEAADRDRLAIWLGDILVAKDGEVAPELSRGGGRGLHEGAGDRHPYGCRRGQGSGNHMDLRPHQRLYRHQCRYAGA